MVGAGVNDQVFVEQNITDGILCEHPFDRASHHLIRMLFHQVLHQDFLETAGIARVMSIQLLIHLVSSDLDLGRIYNNTAIAEIEAVVGIGWLVLATDKYCDHLRHSTQRHFLCIEQVPCLSVVVDRHICRFGLLLGNDAVDIAVHKVIRHFHGTLADVRVKLGLCDFGLWLELLSTLTLLSMCWNCVGLFRLQERGELKVLVLRRS